VIDLFEAALPECIDDKEKDIVIWFRDRGPVEDWVLDWQNRYVVSNQG